MSVGAIGGVAAPVIMAVPVIVTVLVAAPAGLQGQDPARAHADACDAGDPASCTLLGLMYETGAGRPQDLERALRLYQTACDGGFAVGCTRLELALTGAEEVRAGDAFLRIGRVADAGTAEPIGGAVVELPRAGVRVISDAEGRVSLGRLGRGRYRIVTRRPGFASLAGELPVPWDGEFLVLLEPTGEADEPGLGHVFGRVTEAGGADGIAQVEVAVSGAIDARTLTDSEGRFFVTGLEPGRAELRFVRLGYAARSVTVEIDPDRTTEVGVAMAARPIDLEPIAVTVGSAYLQRSGFFRRARTSWGTRFTRRDVQLIEPIHLSELLVRAPGVSVADGPFGSQVVTRRRAVTTYGEPCRLRPYLDGTPMFDWDIDQVRPEDVDGIEIYQGASAPIEYRDLIDPDGRHNCGVILIWTRRNE